MPLTVVRVGLSLLLGIVLARTRRPDAETDWTLVMGALADLVPGEAGRDYKLAHLGQDHGRRCLVW
jgi:hypothetical protein